jgi:hypothetical protein
MSQFTIDDMMKAYSEDAIDLANQMGINLDYSEESLKNVEEILERYHQGIPKGLKKFFTKVPSEEEITRMSKVWGGYIGEVIKKRLGGEWGLSSDNAITLILSDGSEIYPPSKANKRIINGPEDNVVHYYQIIKRDLVSNSK